MVMYIDWTESKVQTEETKICATDFGENDQVFCREHLLRNNTCRATKTQNKCKTIKRETHTNPPTRTALSQVLQ